MSTSPANGSHRQELAALAAGAAADPRKARAAVARLARPLAAPDLAPFFEDACRVFAAAGEGELATGFFGQARKVDRDHPGLVDLDRIHRVHLEFVPAGLVAPTVLRDHVKVLAAALPAADAHARFLEILDAAFAAGVVPYARAFPDVRTLAKAAGIKKRAADDDLAERLLRAGVLPGAPHAIWNAAADPLARLAGRDPELAALLVAAAPDPDGELFGEIRVMWLGALADAEVATAPEWLAAHAAACPDDILLRLVDRAGGRCFPAGEEVDWDTDPAVGRPAGPQAPRSRDPELAGLAARDDPEARFELAARLDAFVAGLGYFGNVDYAAVLKEAWEVPGLRRELRESAAECAAGAASASLPELEHGLTRLVPLVAAGYAELDPGVLDGPAVADPLEALHATLRGGLPEELRLPALTGGWCTHRPRTVTLHGDHLTVGCPRCWTYAVDLAGGAATGRTPAPPAGMTIWHDGRTFLVSRRRDGRWQTFRVDGSVGQSYAARLLLTLDPESAARHPVSPAEAAVTLPGAAEPSRVEYAVGVLRLVAPDGTVTARSPFRQVQPLTEKAPAPLYPPGCWHRLEPVDPEGSRALRELDAERARRLLETALAGDAAVAEALPSLLPEVTAPPLRGAIVAAAGSAVECLRRSVRLSALAGVPEPPSLPGVVHVRPDLPVGQNITVPASIRRFASALEEAAAHPAPQDGPYRIAETSLFGWWNEFGRMGDRAFQYALPWTADTGRAWLSDHLCAWANTPWGDGSGRWRQVRFTPLGVLPRTSLGVLWRTANGALSILEYTYWTATEFSPSGRFEPVELPEWEANGVPVPQGWGGADRVVELRRLRAERGPIEPDPAWARELAEQSGLAVADAAMICFRSVPETGPAEIRALLTDPASGGRAEHRVPFPTQDAVRAALMPDDPADLWAGRVDVARAAARYRELGGTGPAQGTA